VIDGVVKSWFTGNELAFGTRNPRTSIYVQPYGFSELEQLIHQITSHLYAEEYNARYFSQGGTTKGIINIKSDPTINGVLDANQIEGFKRQWHAQISGLTGAWKTPIVQTPGLEYLNVNQSNREMEFEKWMNYLINIACAVYQIDPAEVNFPNNGGAGGSGGALFEGNAEGRLKNSKDKGLRPLLRHIEGMINKYIISRFSNEYVFNFVGIDAQTEKEVLDLDKDAVRVFKTVNEIRKERDMKPIDSGDIILDSTYIQYLNMKSQQDMMAQQGATMSEEDEEDEEVPEREEEYEGEEDINEEEQYDFGWEDSDVDIETEEEDIEKGLNKEGYKILEIFID